MTAPCKYAISAPHYHVLTIFSSVNEIFDPDRVEPFYALPASVRKHQIEADHATNYSVVRLELIEQVYNTMYAQKLRDPNTANWAHKIVPLNEVHSVVESAGGKVDLRLQGVHGAKETTVTTEGYDLVVFGTGYRRNVHRQLLTSIEGLFEGDCVIDRNYKVQFKDGAVARGCGIWLQGCNEATHGLSDSLLSILAVRGGKLVDSMFPEQLKSVSKQPEQIRAQL